MALTKLNNNSASDGILTDVEINTGTLAGTHILGYSSLAGAWVNAVPSVWSIPTTSQAISTITWQSSSKSLNITRADAVFGPLTLTDVAMEDTNVTFDDVTCEGVFRVHNSVYTHMTVGTGKTRIHNDLQVDGIVTATTFRQVDTGTTAFSLDSNGRITTGEDLIVTGSLTSTGIEDLATSTQIKIDSNNNITFGFGSGGISSGKAIWSLKDANGGNTHVGWVSSGAADNTASAYYTYGSAGAAYWRSFDASTGNYTTRFSINSSGNATFAGNLTASHLELEGTDDSILTLRSTDDGPLYVEFERGTDRHAYMGIASSGDDFYIKNEETTGGIRLLTSDGSELRINAGGDVKITSGDLDVTTADGGGISVTGGTGNYDNSAFTFYQGGRARFGYDGSGSGKVSISDYNSSGTTLNKLIAFETHGAEVMRIDEGAVEFRKGIEEQQYSLTGTLIDPANGTMQYKSMQSNATFTESLSNGEFVTLRITPVFNSTATWPTISWIGGSAPVLVNNEHNFIELWHLDGTLYGAFVGTA